MIFKMVAPRGLLVSRAGLCAGELATIAGSRWALTASQLGSAAGERKTAGFSSLSFLKAIA